VEDFVFGFEAGEDGLDGFGGSVEATGDGVCGGLADGEIA
jgi:hypothetical protein